MAYYELEPWGERRADLRAGIVASTIANVNRDPKRRAKAYAPEEFMPREGPVTLPELATPADHADPGEVHDPAACERCRWQEEAELADGHEPIGPDDMPAPRPGEQSWEAQLAFVRMLNEAFGGTTVASPADLTNPETRETADEPRETDATT